MRRQIAILSLIGLAGLAWSEGLIDVGDRAPDFALTIGTRSTKLNELVRQGPVLIRFAATG